VGIASVGHHIFTITDFTSILRLFAIISFNPQPAVFPSALKELSLRVFENGVLRRIFGPKKEEEIGG
jgi:hypothetical protein